MQVVAGMIRLVLLQSRYVCQQIRILEEPLVMITDVCMEQNLSQASGLQIPITKMYLVLFVETHILYRVSW